jgi:hypothetical protein
MTRYVKFTIIGALVGHYESEEFDTHSVTTHFSKPDPRLILISLIQTMDHNQWSHVNLKYVS